MKKLPAFIASCACAVGITLMASPADAAVLTQGMRSGDVVQLQRQLAQHGFFHANTTGYYGSITTSAVKQFQRAHGLSADGVAGPATLSKLGGKRSGIVTASARVSSSSSNRVASYHANDKEAVDILAHVIYGEARGESFRGQVAVGAVVLNRVQSGQFPNTIWEVVMQPGQFTAVADGQYYLKPNQSAYNAARQALRGVDPTNGSLYYYNPRIATSQWSMRRPAVITVGQHIFTN
ncbi:cell wall hydrolase [Paenibacillus bovis]|uniref:Cell wall hydrolase n=1 Tax=Paenibacillus bovis TaxID=1616788 RepID=A0A172ZL87_9BACL|nr:cell wall hydrolase [Paenibacillus bovis]ANF97900.1 cell wall hydrolase [Paenibacillus bovis]